MLDQKYSDLCIPLKHNLIQVICKYIFPCLYRGLMSACSCRDSQRTEWPSTAAPSWFLFNNSQHADSHLCSQHIPNSHQQAWCHCRVTLGQPKLNQASHSFIIAIGKRLSAMKLAEPMKSSTKSNHHPIRAPPECDLLTCVLRPDYELAKGKQKSLPNSPFHVTKIMFWTVAARRNEGFLYAMRHSVTNTRCYHHD